MDSDSQPYLTSLNESTFLLCKPDVEKEHGHILQLVSDAGFQVQARSFVITPGVAKEIASLFGSVQQRLQQDKEQGRPTTPSRSAGPRPPTRREELLQKLTSAHAASDKAPDSLPCGRIVQAHRPTEEAHNGLMAEIRRLTMRHRGTEAGVNAGLPSSAETSSTALLGAAGGGEAAAAGESETRASSRSGTGKGRPNSAASATAAGRTRVNSPRSDALGGRHGVREQLHAMSYAELLEEHVRHLALHGTCLAVLLSAPNAVERLLGLVGPEDPLVARRVAPHSLRARLGSDLVRNAVYAAANLADAATCIRLVFGYSSPYDTQPALDAYNTNRNTAAAVAAAAGAMGAKSYNKASPTASPVRAAAEMWPGAERQGRARGEARITGAPLRLRPGRQALHLPSAQAFATTSSTHTGNTGGEEEGSAPVSFAALVPSPAECPAEWRVSYYIDDPQSNAWWMDEMSYSAAAYAAQPSADAQPDVRGEDNAEQRLQLLQRRLSEEKARLTQQAAWLQQREMDLLLREQALQDALQGSPRALSAAAGTTLHAPLPMIASTGANSRSPAGSNALPGLSPLRHGAGLKGNNNNNSTSGAALPQFSLLLPRRPSENGSAVGITVSSSVNMNSTNNNNNGNGGSARMRMNEASYSGEEEEVRRSTAHSSPITALPPAAASATMYAGHAFSTTAPRLAGDEDEDSEAAALAQASAELLRSAQRATKNKQSSSREEDEEEEVVVSAEDATALVTQPARQWALFQALAGAHNTAQTMPSAVVPVEAVVALYERSPALRGIEADEARGTARLRRFIASVTSAETCDFNTFALILAHLLKE